MINVEKLLGNIFDKQGMSRVHLLAYSKDQLKRLIANNDTHIYDTIIAFISPLIVAFDAELTTDDTTRNLRAGQTGIVEIVTDDFGNTMSTREDEIARKLGGINSVAFKEIYPHGQSEYTRPSRDNMEKFTKRINLAATKYAADLGAEITAELQNLKVNYNAARDPQTDTIADLSATKKAVTTNQIALSKGLTKVLHQIGTLYPGDAAACNSLFNFNLLYPVTHHPHTVYSGVLLPVAEITVLNQALGETMQIAVENTGNNADFWIWIGDVPAAQVHGKAVLVKAGKLANFKPSDLQELAGTGTYLTIKNANVTNSASYTVTIIG